MQFHLAEGNCAVSSQSSISITRGEVKGSDANNNDNNYNHADVISCSADKAPRNQLSPCGVLRITPEGPLEHSSAHSAIFPLNSFYSPSGEQHNQIERRKCRRESGGRTRLKLVFISCTKLAMRSVNGVDEERL